jgi:hypothetical protein
MPVVLVIVAVLAVGFLVMWIQAYRSGMAYRAEADATAAGLTTERDHARVESATRATQRDEARALAETREAELEASRAKVTRLEAQSSQLSGAVRRLTGDVDEARAAAAARAAEIEAQAAEIGALVLENNALEARAETAEAAVIAAEARDTGVMIGDVLGVGEVDASTLWSLELARSKRTWRTSVAPNPFADPTPFDETDDPARLAVEIEAAALRENVGAYITINWDAAPVADATRRHLVVRVAQELLEAAARNPEPLRLVVTGDQVVTLRLQARDDPDKPIDLAPSLPAAELIEVSNDNGLSVTLKGS